MALYSFGHILVEGNRSGKVLFSVISVNENFDDKYSLMTKL